ncbi:hypothetical protein EON67_02255, partial [archaeon]
MVCACVCLCVCMHAHVRARISVRTRCDAMRCVHALCSRCVARLTCHLPNPPPHADGDPTHVWYPSIVYFKVYEDVVVYFSLLLSVVVIGLVANRIPAARRFLHRRFLVPCLPKWFTLWPHGMCVGEASVLAVVAALYVYWFWYWSFGYPRIAQEAAGMLDRNPTLQTAARVLGHMTTLTMSLLTFPMARNSVWESVFGMPFERAVKYHRALGRLTWLLVTLHMVLWDIKWAKEGTLGNNVVTVSNLIIANTNDGTESTHADNFTVVIVEFVCVPCCAPHAPRACV